MAAAAAAIGLAPSVPCSQGVYHLAAETLLPFQSLVAAARLPTLTASAFRLCLDQAFRSAAAGSQRRARLGGLVWVLGESEEDEEDEEAGVAALDEAERPYATTAARALLSALHAQAPQWGPVSCPMLDVGAIRTFLDFLLGS